VNFSGGRVDSPLTSRRVRLQHRPRSGDNRRPNREGNDAHESWAGANYRRSRLSRRRINFYRASPTRKSPARSCDSNRVHAAGDRARTDRVVGRSGAGGGGVGPGLRRVAEVGGALVQPAAARTSVVIRRAKQAARSSRLAGRHL
jgi:hypothetical protein